MGQKLYYNGTILTVDENMPLAGYVLTEDERIAEVGSDSQAALRQYSKAERVDLQGRLMVPGFIDSHLHVLTAALNHLKLDITDMLFESVDSMLTYIRSQKPGAEDEWISVSGFCEENIASGQMVTRWDIDRYFPEVPVTIIRVCGHKSIINSKAVERLDKDRMATITGGQFLKDENGEYNGIATEGAQQYVLDTMPNVPEQIAIECMVNEQEKLMAYGITSVHDAGTDMMLPRDYIPVYQKMDDLGKMKIRTSLMVRPGDKEPFEEFDAYLKDLKAKDAKRTGRLHIGAIKLFADGSLGGRTAAVMEPYEGEPENYGLLLDERNERYITQAVRAGHQVAVHAIGDRAVRYVAEHYAAAENCKGSRQRIEHAEMMCDELIAYIKKNQLLIMTQPIFIREFGNTYFNNLGTERAMWIQPLRTLLAQGIPVGFGTDYPVDDANPLLGIQTAMTRAIKGTDGRTLNRKETITFAQALRCYTLNNAYGDFRENEVGSIQAGKLADFAIISGADCAPDGVVESVANAVVDMTVIGGETVFTRKQ